MPPRGRLGNACAARDLPGAKAALLAGAPFCDPCDAGIPACLWAARHAAETDGPEWIAAFDGCPFQAFDPNGRGALHYACCARSPQILAHLLRLCGPNAQDCLRQTPLHALLLEMARRPCASAPWLPANIAAFLRAGSDPELHDASGRSCADMFETLQMKTVYPQALHAYQSFLEHGSLAHAAGAPAAGLSACRPRGI